MDADTIVGVYKIAEAQHYRVEDLSFRFLQLPAERTVAHRFASPPGRA
jgi:hypothetical protein